MRQKAGNVFNLNKTLKMSLDSVALTSGYHLTYKCVTKLYLDKIMMISCYNFTVSRQLQWLHLVQKALLAYAGVT